jgi:hypothetical protein
VFPSRVGIQEAHRGAADRVDEFLEAVEVDVDDVVDRDAEFPGDRCCEHIGAVAVGRVDPAGILATHDVDPQVARQAHDRCAVGIGLLAQDHDRVGPPPSTAPSSPIDPKSAAFGSEFSRLSEPINR